MHAYEINDQVICAVGHGMAAAADRFGERMAQIREHSNEQKASQTWKEMAFAHAVWVDELDAVLRKHKAQAQRGAAELTKTKEELDRSVRRGRQADKHIQLLTSLLVEAENALQEESAEKFALAAFCQNALREIKTGVTATESVCLDQAKSSTYIAAKTEQFMKTQNVKKGVPPLPPVLQPYTRPFVPQPKPVRLPV